MAAEIVEKKEAKVAVKHDTELSKGIWGSSDNWLMAGQMAKALSCSTIVPKDYQGNEANALVAIDIANRLQTSPLMVMQNLYVIQGRPSWSAQFLIASVNGSGKYGFLISHPEMGRLLYITDTELIKWRFYDVHQILVEANYSKKIIQEDDPNYEHVCRGHMELETTLEFLKVNKSMDLRNVVLLHLSDDNSDAELFAARAKEVVGMADVYVADRGMEIELNKEPF